MDGLDKLRFKYHIRWASPSEFYFTNLYGKQNNLRWWAFHIWNEYDDWLFNGVHGFRLLGLEVNQVVGLLDSFFWKLLPIIRFFNRRSEWTHEGGSNETLVHNNHQ